MLSSVPEPILFKRYQCLNTQFSEGQKWMIPQLKTEQWLAKDGPYSLICFFRLYGLLRVRGGLWFSICVVPSAGLIMGLLFWSHCLADRRKGSGLPRWESTYTAVLAHALGTILLKPNLCSQVLARNVMGCSIKGKKRNFFYLSLSLSLCIRQLHGSLETMRACGSCGWQSQWDTFPLWRCVGLGLAVLGRAFWRHPCVLA